MTSSNDEIAAFLLIAVRQGDINQLKTYLSSMNDPTIYLNRLYDASNNQTYTLIMMACLNEFDNVVETLLSYSSVDLEMLNDIELIEKDGTSMLYQDVTILWAAAAINNFKIVKLLVENGAQINHTTKTNSTAFRCACCNGNIDIARYLQEHGADIHIPKIHNETNLIASVFNEDMNITTYLVDELACDINESIDDGRSPLYIAANRESLEFVRFLLQRGARNFRAHYDNMSPILLAAEKRRLDIFNEIFAHCSLLDQIEALEFLGSVLACNEFGAVNLEESFQYFSQAFELRMKHNLPKALQSSTVEVFDHRQECQTVDELEKICTHMDNMNTEALLVRERLLGPTNAKYRRSLRFRGAILADSEQHAKGIEYWLYEIEIHRQYSLPINKSDFRQWASIFADMTRYSPNIPAISWQTITNILVDELESNETDFDYNLHTLLFLITIASQIIPNALVRNDDRKTFYRQVRSIVQRQYALQANGFSLLHLSLTRHTQADDHFIDWVCKYPCLQTTCMLLRCGIDPNAADVDGNNPLHIFASQSDLTSDKFVRCLHDAGAHLDYANAVGDRAMDVATNSIMKLLIKRKMDIRLKCLCARLIRKNKIIFHGKITKALINFVERH